MPSVDSDQVSLLLERAGKGDRGALDELIPLVYDELRRIASRFVRKERKGQDLQVTALVNEAYIRLIGQRDVTWQNRSHFFGVAANLMRRILVDHARTAKADKRGGGAACVTLNDENVPVHQRSADIVALDEALARLANRDPKLANLVELRYFAGLTTKEAADVLGVSVSTVEREWVVARAWLYRAMTVGEEA